MSYKKQFSQFVQILCLDIAKGPFSPHDFWPRSGSSLFGTLMAASTVSYFYEPLYQPFANHHNCEVIIEDNMKQTF